MISVAVAGTACIDCRALTHGRVLTATSAPSLPALLGHLPERLLTKDLIDDLEDVADIIMERQPKDAVGASWVAVTARNEVARKETVDLLSDVETQDSSRRNS